MKLSHDYDSSSLVIDSMMPSEDKQVLEEDRCTSPNTPSHGHNGYNNTPLTVARLHDDTMPPENTPLTVARLHDDTMRPENTPLTIARLHDNPMPSENIPLTVARHHDNTMPSESSHYLGVGDDLPSANNGSLGNYNLLLLPIDIIVNILNRLNIESALQCRRVCRPLYEMMSTPFFEVMRMQFSQAAPILIAQHSLLCSVKYDKETNLHTYHTILHFINNGNNRNLKISTQFSLNGVLTKYPNPGTPQLIGYNGLLLFRKSLDYAFFIFNPITQEQVLVKGAPYNYIECGLYFHTPTSEYRILYMCLARAEPSRFFILSPRSKSLREISKYTEVPCTCKVPVNLNGTLHWMASVGRSIFCSFRGSPSCSKSILVFKLDSEEFLTMPHPGSQCCSKERQRTNMHLFEMERHLCLCDTLSSIAEVHVWVLRDYMKRIWVKRHIIDINLLLSECAFKSDTHGWATWPIVEALQLHNDELLLSSCSRVLYCYHVKLHTLRKINSGDKLYFDSMVVHRNSLVSLQSDRLISWQDLKMCTTK